MRVRFRTDIDPAEELRRKFLLLADEGEGDGDGAAGGGEGDPAAGPADADAADGDPGSAEASSDDWRATIQDADLRKVAERFASPADAVKAVADLRKRESNSIRLPGEDASDEDLAAFRKAIGVPETAESYEFEMPEGREATDDDKAFQGKMAEAFHKLNISAAQAKGLNEVWNELTAAAQEALVTADKAFADETEAALKAEWPGEEFQRNKQFADTAADRLFGETIDDVRQIETKDGRFVLDHPAFVKMLAQVGREMAEPGASPIVTESQAETLDNQIAEFDKKIMDAQSRGERSEANRLYQQQQDIFRKRFGGAPIVGSEGRTV